MLRKYIKKYKCILYFGFFLSIFGLTGQLLTPLIIGKVIDAITDKDYDRVNYLVGVFMILQITSIFSGLQKYVFSLITEKFGQ